MITEHTGNIFLSTASYITIPVNTVGVAGAGLAKQFALQYPVSLRLYQNLCSRGMTTGRIYVLEPFILFPTKKHWRNPSKLDYITAGLHDLKYKLLSLEIIGSIALPRLGCGLGGLNWETQVYPAIIRYLADLENPIEVYIK